MEGEYCNSVTVYSAGGMGMGGGGGGGCMASYLYPPRPGSALGLQISSIRSVRRVCPTHCMPHYIAALAGLGTLLEDLESIQATWYNFGLQLNVDVAKLDAIKVEYSNPLDCLRETLKQWLKTSCNCTWKCIFNALGSSIVGAKALALKLERQYCPQLDTHASQAQAPHTQAQILYSQASAPMFPQSPPAAKRPRYSSVGSSSNLSPAIAIYARYLRACYTRSSLPENNKFPPTPSKHYINLAYISRRTVSRHESEQFKVAMVRGEIDEIARDKGLDFCHVAKKLPDGSYPQVVLVEGAPGVGKTTFAWEFCKKWGNGELEQEYSLVILLRLRDKRIQEAKCLRDLLYHPDETLPDVIATELINSLGEGVLILLEGLDELPESQRTESSVFLELIHGRLLPLATVLITTRPWASEYLHRNCKEKISQHVEILGFTKQQVESFLHSVYEPDDDPSLLPDIEKYLSCYPQIHAAMYIPLNAAIVVEVYRRSRTGECIIPKTMTELYTALSQTLLIRYLQEHPVHGKTKWKIHNFSDLPSDVYEHFLQLSEVAYDSIKNDQKLVFSSEDLPQNLQTLGFMQSVPEVYVNESFSHNFLHLTIQEYLAAVYITQLSPEEQLKHFDECGGGLFKVVMMFVAGLTKFAGIPSDHVRALFEKGGAFFRAQDVHEDKHLEYDFEDYDSHYYDDSDSESYDDELCVDCDYTVNSDQVNWMFETQDPDTMNAILGSSNTIKLGGCQLPFDYYCLGYCIAHSHCWWGLTFESGITEEDINMLALGGNKSRQTTSISSTDLPRLLVSTLRLLPSLKALEWSFAMLSLGGLRELCDLLASTTNSLEIVNITGTYHYDDHKPSYVTIEGKYQHTLVFVHVLISSVDDVTGTVSVLTENSNLGLHITAIRIMEEKWESMDREDLVCRLAEALHDTKTLKKLTLKYCPIEMKEAMAVVKLIPNNKSLEKMVVRDMIRCCGVSIMRSWTSTGKTKLELSVSNTAITVGYLREMCDLLASTSNRFENHWRCVYGNLYGCAYYLFDNHHHHKSYVTIEGKYQHRYHSSVSVDVHISSVEDVTGAVAVLTENSNLGLHITEIRLQKHCESIDGDLACQLAEALHNTKTLKTLKIIDHPIETKGAMAIAQLLLRNNSLEKVDIHGCNFDNEGACHLTQALRDNTAVRELACTKLCQSLADRYFEVYQRNCSIGEREEILQFAQACSRTRVRELDLSYNPIGTKGAMALAELIHHNKSLEEVNVSGCKIDSEGACHLAQALCGNTTLRELDLSCNPIGHDGAVALAEMLHTNTSLQILDLYDLNTPLSEEGTHKLLEAMKFHCNLQLTLPEECEGYTVYQKLPTIQ